MAYPEYDPNEPSLGQTFADLLRGVKNPKSWQEVGQGIQNVAKVTPSVVESLGRGALVQLPALAGDTSQLARQFIPETMQNTFGNRTAPTSEELLAKIPRINPNYQGSEQHEMVGGLISPAMPSLLRAGAKATQNMPIGNMIAYHGTPHEIKGAFDMSKVGTGEGAQAYGHGMYFAENPTVAESYKTVAGKTEFVRFGDKIVPTASQEGQLLSDVTKLGRKAAINKYPDQADYIKTINPDNIKFEGGNLYKVDIPDAYIPTMMDYDKPLGQQSAIVKKALNGIKKQITPEMKMELGGDMNLLFGKDVTPVKFLNTMEIIHPTGGIGIGEKMLNELGVKGMRYLDATSRDTGKGTSNFVVFDPKEVKILEKNSKPVNTLENVVAPLKEKGLTLDIYESKNNPNKLVLSKIEVPKELRKSGVGSNAMQELTGFADKQNKTITLSPSTDFGGSSVSRLKDFYKRFGFVENKGRYKDYSISESMYRLPTKLSRKDIIEEQVNNLK